MVVTAVVLAAGTGSRMGSPKPLLPLRGKPFLQHVVDRVDRSGIREIVVVVGYQHTAVRESVTLPEGGRFVLNREFRSGQASSLARGLGALRAGTRAAAIFLADEPELAQDAVRRVVDTYAAGRGPVVRAVYRGRPGHPVILDRSIWGEVVNPGEDRGAGPILALHPEWVVDVETGLAPHPNLDTPDDYRTLTGERPPLP